MVKTMKLFSVFLLAALLSAESGLAGESATLDSVKGKDITQELAKTLPHRDCSMPQMAFLGFLRSNLEGNIRDHLFYLTPDAKKKTAGVEDESAISDERARKTAEAIKNSGFEKIKLDSFLAIPEVSPTQIVAVVSSSRCKMAVREKYEISVVQTNGQWKFSTVNVSVIDRKPVDE